MISELRTEAIVQPGGLVQIRSDDLTEGTAVKVILTTTKPESKEVRNQNLVDFIGAAKGLFSSVEDVDAYSHEERDSWDS